MRKFIIFITVILLLLSLTGCDEYIHQIKEDATEKLLEKLIGDDVEVDIIYKSSSPDTTPENDNTSGIIKSNQDVEQNNYWSDEIPAEIPKVDLIVVSKIKTPNGIIMDFGAADISFPKQYIEILKNSLYETINEEIKENLVDATYRKDDYLVKIYWYKDGLYSLMITWK